MSDCRFSMGVPPPTRTIGPFTVSAIGLGCMNLSHGYFPRPDPAQAEAVLLHALDSGVNFFDTAALYGFGENEALLGRTIMHRRNAFTLASKCVLGQVNGQRGLDGSPRVITQAIDDSLRRLRTDRIDLHYLHRLDPQVPIEESVGALARGVEAGKICAIGLSEMSAAIIRRAHAVHPVAAVQTEYSPWTRNAEIAVLDCCAELGIGFVAFSPLARGLFAGSVESTDFAANDIRATMPRFQGANLAANLVLLDRLRSIAFDVGCTTAQLCLAWLLSRRDFIVPIPGTTNIAHLEENLGALRLNVPADMFDAVDAIFPWQAVAGARYTAAAQSQIDTEIWPGEQLA